MKRRELLFWIVLVVGIPVLLLIPAVNAARQTTLAMQCTNNLKQVSIAVQNYNATFGHLPPSSIYDAGGNAIHSWRAVVTPYMAALPQVYRWDEPWNGTQNERLLNGTTIHIEGPTSGKPAKGLPWHGPIDYAWAFRCSHVNSPTKFHIEYYAIVGTECAWSAGKNCNLTSIGDGIENTLLVAESITINALWSQPKDLEFNHMSFQINDLSCPSISSKHKFGPAVIFADGSVFRLDPKIPKSVVKGLLTANGGERIDRDEIRRSGWLH